MRLTQDSAKILDIALDCGFGDVSNFNPLFRTEFGVSPHTYRLTVNGRAPRGEMRIVGDAGWCGTASPVDMDLKRVAVLV
jgi:Helix-turn-helix domain